MSATALNLQPVQLWNGHAMSYVSEAEAVALVKAGTHERVKGRAAHTLKPASGFKTAELKAEKAPPTASKKPPRRARGQYKTTQMKAE